MGRTAPTNLMPYRNSNTPGSSSFSGEPKTNLRRRIMTDLPTRVYRVFLLNADVQKRQDDVFIAENVRIGPSGVLECDRIWADTSIKTKIFYSGEFHVIEMDEQEIKEFHDPLDCEHGE